MVDLYVNKIVYRLKYYDNILMFICSTRALDNEFIYLHLPISVTLEINLLYICVGDFFYRKYKFCAKILLIEAF